MAEEISVTGKFSGILTGLLDYVAGEHGDHAAHRLFFELYSQVFAHLEKHHGSEALERYWQHLADNHLYDLDRLIAEHGFAGMRRYWGEVAEQERAGFETELHEDRFSITVRHCPPRQWFADQQFEAFDRYHEHCPALYSRVAARYGYDTEYEPPDDTTGRCCKLTFTTTTGS